MYSVDKKIEAARRERKISQEELAKSIGVSRFLIYKLETGKTTPDIHTLDLLAKALEKPFSYFISDILGENKAMRSFQDDYQDLVKLLSDLPQEKVRSLITLLQ